MSAAAVLLIGLLGALAGAGAVWLLAPALARRRSGTPAGGAVDSSLRRLEDRLETMESERHQWMGGLTEQLRGLQEAQEGLRGEAARLSRALRDPGARGRWGELQLRRVVEMAGLAAHCDFVEQPTLAGPDGALRPDLVVRLPGGRSLAVDAKVPLHGWLTAVDAVDESDHQEALRQHARQLRSHVGVLASREYWAALPGSPEMVVAFLPGDGLLSAALEADAGLMDYAVAHHVMLATPVTLIAMLRAVAFGWRQEALVDNARAVADTGRELYRRLGTLSEHLAGVGRSLDRTVAAFNDTVGSLESRVLVSARRLSDLAGDPEIGAPGALTAATRPLRPPPPGDAEG